MNLHWHTEDNPCELCGVPVTPESWANGVIDWQEQDVRWGMYRPQFNEASVTRADSDWHVRKFCAPIFPPRGWAGKSDAELWDAVFGASIVNLARGVAGFDKWEVAASQDGGVFVRCCDRDDPEDVERVDNPAAMILALRNAQVLAARLREAQ